MQDTPTPEAVPLPEILIIPARLLVGGDHREAPEPHLRRVTHVQAHHRQR